MRLNKQLQKTVDRLVADKMEMQYDIDVLKRHLEKINMEHTTTKSRIIFAKHILDGNRDEKVIEHMHKTHITKNE
jgi:hypothetical protein